MAGKYKRTARKASSNRGAVAVLRRARALVKRGWCQGAIAQTAAGDCTNEHSESAAKWCAWGALLAAGGRGGAAYDAAYERLVDAVGSGISWWNDARGRTKTQILRGFDKAIAKAEAAR